MSSLSPLPPPTVCSWHHRTKVHLAGHWLPRALLTDRQPKAPILTSSVWSGRAAGRPQRLPDITGSPEAALALALSPRLKSVFVCVSMNFSLERSLNQSPGSRHVGLFLLAPHPDGSSGNWVSGSPGYSLRLLGGMWHLKEIRPPPLPRNRGCRGGVTP